MTINREMKTVEVLTFADTVDQYGQKRQSTPTKTTIEMCIKIYSENNVNNPIYANVEYIGLTKNNSITDANQIVDGDITYDILHIIPSSRLTQVLMRKHK